MRSWVLAAPVTTLHALVVTVTSRAAALAFHYSWPACARKGSPLGPDQRGPAGLCRARLGSARSGRGPGPAGCPGAPCRETLYKGFPLMRDFPVKGFCLLRNFHLKRFPSRRDFPPAGRPHGRGVHHGHGGLDGGVVPENRRSSAGNLYCIS